MGEIINLFDDDKANEALDKMSESEIESLIEKALGNLEITAENPNDYIEDIADYYRTLIELATNCGEYNAVEINREDIRLVTVDGKKYDFDEIFCHDDEDAAECLCAIDALIGDLSYFGVSQSKAIARAEKKLKG